jgi:dTDP-4-dehydrorhamnose 3,5-epimerase
VFRPVESPIPGCWELHPTIHTDPRGRFVKSFHAPTFERLGLATDWREDFHTLSAPGVVRGMHFQVPPAQHAKLVTCLAGDILDVVLDLRKASGTYGRFATFELSAERGTLVYVPEGCAHGFLAHTEALVHYRVTSVHAPDCDAGIRWDGFGFDWPVAAPLLSARDQAFPTLQAFSSPF